MLQTMMLTAILALNPGFQEGKKANDDKKTTDKINIDGDLKLLQGQWTLTSLETSRGKQAMPEGMGKVVFTDKGYTFELKSQAGDPVQEQGTMTLKELEGKRAVDVDIKVGSEAGQKQFGIYSVSESELKFCFAKAGAADSARPKEFKVTAGSEEMIFVFKKNAPKKDDKPIK